MRESDIRKLPEPFDPARTEDTVRDWQSRLAENEDMDETLAGAPDLPAAKPLVAALAGNSPFLAKLIPMEALTFARLLTDGPDKTAQTVLADLAEYQTAPPELSELMRLLRIARRRIALVTAAADVAGIWDLETVTETLSTFAEKALQAAVTRLLEDRYAAGDLVPPEGAEDAAARAAASGYTVLAMGKLGARELNYSSDIDLIVLYDTEVVQYQGRGSVQDCFIRLTRDLVRALQDLTGEGYVFRVDLRLRPDPGATPLALSMDAAEIYYQSTGLNWERAAMIKARPVAGDLEAGNAFLERIKAFVWRKHLDYAAVKDIQDIKGKVHSHHRHKGIVFAGQDIKLGYGGIREIEFFAQIYQLIMGGREFDLRVPRTLGALDALTANDKITSEEAEILTGTYRYLRRLEHRLQMINDEQTHVLPEDTAELDHVARFMGYETRAAFKDDLLPRLEAVHTLYDGLFAETQRGPEETQEPGWDRFADPDKAKSIVDTWLLGRYRACRSPRAREILEELVPAIVNAFGAATEPDAALVRFDEFLSSLPSGVQLFSLCRAHPWLIELLAEIMGSAPALADTLSRNLLLLDAVLSADFFESLPDKDDLSADLTAQLEHAGYYEEVLDIARRWANDRKFQVGVQILRQVIDARQAGEQLTRVAEVVMRALYPRVSAEFEKRHGTLPGGMVVVGLGKLGARELTFQSDLDLIFLYETDAENSDGEKPLAASQYYARLSQRFINALSAMTAEGKLYEVDMRLRPSGRAGPIAVALDTFVDYQKTRAWTWEHMALTRGRAIIGPAELTERVEKAVRDILTTSRDAETLLAHIADMRARLDQEFGTDDMWRMKFVRGGLLDIEFIIQYLVLKTAPDDPAVLSPVGHDVLSRLTDAGALNSDRGRLLDEALLLQQNVQTYVRLCCGDTFPENQAGEALRTGLAKFCGFETFETLKSRVLDTQAQVYETYDALIGQPAKEIDPEKIKEAEEDGRQS